MEGGLTETVYQYIAGGAAEAVLLMVIIRMSDEPYKIKAIKMYMVDYLENVCAVRVRRQNRKEKEFIDVIPSENVNGGGKVKEQKTFAGADDKKEGASAGTVPVQENRADRKENAKGAATMQETEYEQWRAQAVREILDETGSSMVEKRLPINIEGEPQERKKAEKLSQNVGRGGGEHEPDSGHPQIREETIRQILEEFLA